jgi:uncharacterized protein (DUF1800 family)/uncharacterized protein (DUF1501 family)
MFGCIVGLPVDPSIVYAAVRVATRASGAAAAAAAAARQPASSASQRSSSSGAPPAPSAGDSCGLVVRGTRRSPPTLVFSFPQAGTPRELLKMQHTVCVCGVRGESRVANRPGLVAAASLMYGAAAVTLWLGSLAAALPDSTRSSRRELQSSLSDGTVYAANQTVAFGLSNPGTLAVLTRLSALYSKSAPSGRSYDGLLWEGVQPTALSFNCTASLCTVFLPEYSGPDAGEAYTYRLNILASPDAASDIDLASRFLRHATFGPTRNEIEGLVSSANVGTGGLATAMHNWILQQQALPASLHRAYHRARSNSRMRISGGNGMNSVASMASPCENGSRWLQAAFSSEDENKNLTVAANPSGGFDMFVDGVLRTQVSTFAAVDAAGNLTLPISLPMIMCWVTERVGGTVVLGTPGTCTWAQQPNPDMPMVTGPVTLPNPSIDFAIGSVPDNIVFEAAAADANLFQLSHPMESGAYILQSLTTFCVSAPTGQEAWMKYNGTYYKHDARMRLLENTLTRPATTIPLSGPQWTGTCPSAPKTFLNKHTCVRRPQCTQVSFSDANISLDAAGIRSFYNSSKRFVFRVDGLDLMDFYSSTKSPCYSTWHGNPYSRWEKSAGACTVPTTLNQATLASITAELRKTTDCYRGLSSTKCVQSTNPYLKDIYVSGTCNDAAAKGASVTVDGECWTHVHDNLWDVRDFSILEPYLPQTNAAKMKFDASTLRQAAIDGQIAIDFQSLNLYGFSYSKTRVWQDILSMDDRARFDHTGHAGTRVGSYGGQLSTVGRFGDTINFAELASHLQTPELAALVGSTAKSPTYDGAEACGSPGEVASVPQMGHVYQTYSQNRLGSPNYPDYMAYKDANHAINVRNSKTTVWYTLGLKAQDQLRQRMAWALSQIFALGKIDTATMDTTLEIWTTFMDIFVRNAFGNFRTLLKEIAYSPLMANWLTFLNNKGFGTLNPHQQMEGKYPDENFAREIMELFSIGLHKLDPSTTKPERDTVGNAIPSYDNHDVMAFARVWTGFTLQPFRSNIERRMGVDNYIDPMRIIPEWRDRNPKVDLDDGYLGDRKPLCADLPARPFLRKGATYRYTGHKKPRSPYKPTNEWWVKHSDNIGYLPLGTLSPLRQSLCAADASGTCQFPSEVTLMSNLNCDGTECLVDTVRAVQIVDGGETVFYEYVQIECVHQAFYENATTIKSGQRNNRLMCADPRLPVAGSSCCASAQSTTNPAQARCQYAREYVTYATASSRCSIVTSQYVNQYEAAHGLNSSDHMVSHSGNTYWHVYPQGAQGSANFCSQGCGSAANCPIDTCNPNPNYDSECRSPHETMEVRCCSYTPIQAQPGDWPNQSYATRSCGYGYPGRQMALEMANNTGDSLVSEGGTIPDAPWHNLQIYANGVITNYANRSCAVAANCTDLTTTAVDSNGNACNWYITNTSQCGNFDQSDQQTYFRSNEMCCACGGGATPTNPASDDSCNGCLHAKTFEEASAACAADGARLCSQWEVESMCERGSGCSDNSFVWTSTPCTPMPMHVCSRFSFVDGPEYCQYKDEWTWMNRPCLLQLQVDVSGYVMLVHSGQRHPTDVDNPLFARDNMNVFRVPWVDVDDVLVGGPGNFPHSGDNCSSSGCVKDGLTCLCTPSIATAAVFSDSSAAPSLNQILSQLFIGAPPPDMFDSGTYTLHASSTADVQVWQPASAPVGSYTADTVFKVVINSRQVYLANKVSTVTMGAFSFRNPTVHVSPSQPVMAEVEFETDALIDHLAEHQNTPTFIARLLILRFTTSNPSPRYIRVAAEAFRTGVYNGTAYSGKYGDLAACVAAILLDREARSNTLEADPTHGKIREPTLKVLSFLRSMEYTSNPRTHELVMSLDNLGQVPYRSPSVFNYYQPDFQSPGAITKHSVYSPEAQLLSPPHFVAFINGIIGIPALGLDSCTGFGTNGFGAYPIGAMGSSFGVSARTRMPSWTGCDRAKIQSSDPDVSQIDGVLTFRVRNTSAAAAVAEMDTILTGGRINRPNKAYIKHIYEDISTWSLGSAWPGADAGGHHLLQKGWAGAEHICGLDSQSRAVSCCSDNSSASGFAAPTHSSCISWMSTNGLPPLYVRSGSSCFRGNYAQGVAHCAQLGGRLCSAAELNAHCTYALGCGFSWQHQWSSTPCPDNTQRAMQKAQELIVSTPEFSTDTFDAAVKTTPRPPALNIPFLNRGYKAVIVIYMYGGMDSYNLIVPHSGCPSKDLYAEYASIRGVVALSKTSLLQITVPTGTQPCSQFGIHHKMPHARQFYNDKDLLFVANIGTLLAPITAAAFHSDTALVPYELGSHMGQTRQVQSVHAQHSGAKGILGRFVDALRGQANPYRAFPYSIAGNVLAVQGQTHPVLISKSRGIPQIDSFATISPAIYNMSRLEYKNVFAETYAGMLEAALTQTNLMGQLLKTRASLLTSCCGHGSLGKQFTQIAKVMRLRNHPDVQSERDVFATKLGGFDTHQDGGGKLDSLLAEVDATVKKFSDEMKAQSLWDNVTIVTLSDFGRTLTSNGIGTDHAW